MAPYPKSKDKPENEPPKRLSQKELSKKFRHDAYLRAKEYRKTDPRQIAMMETFKEQRRDAYQKVKKRNKAYRAELKKASDEKAARKKVVKQKNLRAMVVPGSSINPATKSTP